MNTDYKDKDTLSQAHRFAIDKIFLKDKPSLSMQRRDKDDKTREETKYREDNKCREDNKGKEDNRQKEDPRDKNKDSSRLNGPSRYAFEDKVGSGTFGIVHKARDKRTLEMVAIKRVFQDKKYKNR